jgi:hypothetical protein
MADKKPFVAKHGFAVANSTLTVFGSNGKLHANNTISNATITDAMLASTFTTESAFNSALANTNLAIADRLQVANASATYQTIAIERAALANTNSYIADQATRIDLVNTNLTGTNTALRTLIDDRIQVANADTRFLRKDGTAAQSVGGQVTFNNNVLISGNLTVSGTKTEVNTTQVNVSNTYILLNSDLGSGTAATENAGIIVNRGAEANVYFRWNETGEYWEYGEADGTFTKISEAAATTIQARNESGGTINFGQPVSVSGYSAGGERPLVELADADDPAQMPALGLALDTVSTGSNLRVATYGVISNANTGVFSVGQELYVDTVAGKLTGTRPSGDTVKVQKIGQVLRSHASAGSILIQGAGRSNDVPNLEDKHVFIGNTTNGVDTRVLVVSDISNSDTLATNAALQTEVTRIDLVNTNLTGTNTALRTLISDRLQVANAAATYQTIAIERAALANTNLAIADRLQVANASATYQTISVERAALANTNLAIADRLQVANATLLINDRYQVANVDTNFVNKTTSVAQSMTANLAVDSTGSTSGVHISNGAISIFTDTGNPSFVDFYCEVSNLHYARLQSQPHSAYGGSVTVKLPVSDGVLATTTDLATVNTSVNTQATRIDLVNTNLTGTNTALRTLISDRLQVANAITTLAGLTDVAQVTPTDGHVLTYSSSNTTYYFSAVSGGASVTVSNTAPTSPSEGDLWFDEIDATLYVRYGAAWIDAAPVVGSSANNIVFYSANNTLRLYRTDGIELDTTINISGGSLTLAGLTDVAQVTPTDGHVLKYSSANSTYYFAAETGGGGSTPTFSDLVVTTFTANGTQTAFSINNDVTGAEDLIVTLDGVIQRPTTDYTFASNTVTFGTAPINGEIVAIREIKAIGQQIVSGVSNGQFQSYVANTNARLVTLEAGGGGSGDVSNAYLTSTFTTNAVFQSALANTNARLVTLEGGGGGGGNSFSVIEIGGTLIDSAGSTARLSIDAGSGITLTPTAGNNTILIESTGGGIGGDTSSSYQVTTANGTQTTFTSPVSSSDAKAVFVTIDGVVQTPTTDYTISGTTVTTDEAPDSGSVVVVRAGVFYADTTSIIDASTSIATANGTATTFTSPISSTNADRVLVSVDGVIQRPTTDYTISGTVVTFDTAPPNGTIVMVRSIATASQVQELTDLTNVANTTPSNGHVLTYSSANSTYYFAEPSGGGGGASTGTAIAMALVFG